MGREGSGGGCIINAGVRGHSTSHGILVIFFFFGKYGVSKQAEGPWPARVSLCGAETDL